MTEATQTEREQELARLQARVEELERERRFLASVAEMLREILSSGRFVDTMQVIVQKLGTMFGLDRCSVFLSERRGNKVRLVASYEDSGIRNYMVDLDRYPELKEALTTGDMVVIPDVAEEPRFRQIRSTLEKRRVRTIAVVPILWDNSVIGAIFTRTLRDGASLEDADFQFLRVVASLTAEAIRNAYRVERLLKRSDLNERARRADLERAAALAFLQRLLNSFSVKHAQLTDTILPKASKAELDRLVDVAMAVLSEESKAP